ncbi:MAG TPA: hypothetical protein VKB81_10455, partial [Nitrospira sp.]|nr:hypothetical protein [Nitrospira sp.]
MHRIAITRQNVLGLALVVLSFLSACGGDDNNNGGGGGTPLVPPTPVVAYVANQTSNNVSAFTINGTSGALVPVAGSPFPVGTTPGGIAVSTDGTLAYVTNQGSNTVSAFSVNTATGVPTAVSGSPFGAGTTPFKV